MSGRIEYLREKTSRLTSAPGVYIMKNAAGDIIYIGKAKNLRKRVSSYFRENPDHTPKVAAMVMKVNDYDFIVTESEYEALILECSLIKLHKPRYNILLKDDKGYSYICVSGGDYPKITVSNNISGSCIGTYTSGTVAREAVNEANKVFGLPVCNKPFPESFGKSRPCLNYHIKNCMGVCTGGIDSETYGKIVAEAVDFIKSGSASSVKRMEREMNEAAEKLDFEKAALLRDRIAAIKRAAEKQKVINNGVREADVIGTAELYDSVYISVMVYRNERLTDKIVFEVENHGTDVLGEFITQFYDNGRHIPKMIIVETIPEDCGLITELLTKRAGKSVKMHRPAKGKLSELLRLAKSNSAEYAAIKGNRTGREVIALGQLSEILGLGKPPEYIEAYDISNLSSDTIVAGMVVFENGRPLKKAYKNFRIKDISVQNDYASMQEVIERRLRHIAEQEGDEFFRRTPDLILLDGGNGHVNAVAPVLEKYGLNIPLFGMVKDSHHRTRAISSGGREIRISNARAAFNLITQIQDEVHRFSVGFMHEIHRKKNLSSELLEVRGIGQKRLSRILEKYRTREELLEASPDEIAEVAGVSRETAHVLWNRIHDT